jgi:homoserine kinase
MAVFTPVTLDDLSQWIKQFPLGKALALKGIASGIENSNFFLTTERGEYVLTIFENLSFEQLPFYVQLMRHLAERGIPVPAPVPNETGELVMALHGKPAAIVSKLDGSSQLDPQPVHCAEVGIISGVKENKSNKNPTTKSTLPQPKSKGQTEPAIDLTPKNKDNASHEQHKAKARNR